MSGAMLPPGQEADVDVTWEDQQMINSFGRLTNKRHDIEAELKELKQKTDNAEEAQTELIMADGDIPYASIDSYRLADVFVRLPKEEVEAKITEELEELKKQTASLNEQRAQILKTLADLKLKLYGKFKNQINLEE